MHAHRAKGCTVRAARARTRTVAESRAQQFEEPLAWWPAQRPDDVFVGNSNTPVKWTRGIVSGPEDMIKRWHQLGFVVQDGARFVESERNNKD